MTLSSRVEINLRTENDALDSDTVYCINLVAPSSFLGFDRLKTLCKVPFFESPLPSSRQSHYYAAFCGPITSDID
ncbi:unnamed protein product [Albugo candida]|uniref:Uncharacterized protein n=1 Tax=Albugo candida TaxID=65357 RepID=A0A024GI58_9STRA|nr:unnamed protein product [Albugo candida]|eukprot:CCI46430.1 unnamed protein product [Albugo candida]